MRKITSLFLMMLMFVSAVTVSAQNLDDYGMVPLITDSTQLSSPHSESTANEGATCILYSLIDNDPATYWHTAWASNVGNATHHYVQVQFTEAISGDMVLFMQRRASAANDHPTKFAIDGSVDGENWSIIDTLEIGFKGAGTAEVSPAWKISEPVNYLRFTVYDCKPTFRKYWHAAEMQIYRAEGFGFWSNSRHTYSLAGWLANCFTPPVWPEYRSHVQANKFSFISPDNEYGWYACQHVGVENPAFNRRQNGLAPYLANYSALCNYAHHFGPYNDRSGTYKPMVFAYGCGDGVIDTLQWEGFREAVDIDIIIADSVHFTEFHVFSP